VTIGTQPGRLAAAMAKVQAALPKLERDRIVEVTQKNGQTYSYAYATLANLTEAVLPLLAANGLSFVAMPGAGSDGKMCLVYHLMHESGETLSGEFPLSAEGGIQVLGGRITYARRYCLAAVVGIAADEDDESRLSEGEGKPTAQRGPRTRGKAATPAQPANQTVQRASRTPAVPADEPPLSDGEPHRGRGGLITQPMTQKLAITMREVVGDNANDRKQFITDMIGREVASSKDLTFDEGRALIDAFEKAKATDNPIDNVIDIYQRVNQPVPQTAADRTRAAVTGAPDPDAEPPWEPADGAILAEDGTTGAPR
jgi:ERF superfamily protein